MVKDILSLKKNEASILLIEERQRTDIVIGAPHHAIGGEKFLPCPEHIDADENTGFLAHLVAERIKASSIIACNYRIDPNKNLRTDYALQISQWSPKYLIEIHGHGAKGGKKPNNTTVEVSSGLLTRNPYSIFFSDVLSKNIAGDRILAAYSIKGDFNDIYFKAVNTATVTDLRWISFHIELPPSLRIDGKNELPDVAIEFSKHLAATIVEVCNDQVTIPNK